MPRTDLGLRRIHRHSARLVGRHGGRGHTRAHAMSSVVVGSRARVGGPAGRRLTRARATLGDAVPGSRAHWGTVQACLLVGRLTRELVQPRLEETKP